MSSNHTYQVYYKVRQLILLQSATAVLLQSAATVITKRDRYYKVRQNTVLSKVIFFSSQVFGFILVLGTRLAEFILETNYLSRRIIRRTKICLDILLGLRKCRNHSLSCRNFVKKTVYVPSRYKFRDGLSV